MEYIIEFRPDGVKAKISSGKTILDAAAEVSIPLFSACGGKGTCGKCKIIVVEGEVRSQGELSDGLYLACQTYPVTDLVVEIPSESRLGIHQVIEDASSIWAEELSSLDVGIAVDIGTTTVAAYLVDTKAKIIAGYASEYNKQIDYGSDILTRMKYAQRSGIETLNRQIVGTVNDVIDLLIAGRNYLNVTSIVASGGTAMTYFLLDDDPQIILDNAELAEFRLPHVEDAAKLRLKCEGSLYVLPCISGYVGGDIVADILTSGIHQIEKPSMIVDIGTGGGIVVGNKEKLIACSTFAGHAFEGGGIGCGMNATEGAIERALIEDDEVVYSTIKNGKPAGVCGSGLIELTAELYISGLIDSGGKFSGTPSERVRNGIAGAEFVIVYGDETLTGMDIVLTETDIRNIIQSKASIYSGIKIMDQIYSDSNIMDVERIYVAGGFGHYLDIGKAVTIGLLPDISPDRFEFIGNGSMKGAFMVLIDEEKKKEAEEIAQKTIYHDILNTPGFEKECSVATYLPHEDPALFPSVKKSKKEDKV